MRKTQNVQAVTEKKLDPENKPIPEVASTAPNTSPDSNVSRALPIDLSSVDPAKIKMAEGFGIPIGQILSWMQSVEERFNTIEEVLPKKVGEELEKAIVKARAQQPQPNFEVPQQNPGPSVPSGMAGILGLLPQILQSQPQNDLLGELAQKALKGQIAMSEAITNAVVSKIAARATDAVADAVTGA